MKKARLNKLLRVAKEKYLEKELSLTAKQSSFLWGIIRHPVFLSSTAEQFLIDIEKGVYNK